MAMVFSQAQFDRWAKEVGDNLPRYGWIPAFKKIGKYLKDQHKIRLKFHQTPDRAAWAKRYHKPAPRVGESAPILLDDGRVIYQRLKTTRGSRRARAFRQKWGPPMKPTPALVRTTGKSKARTILDFLTKRASGRSIRISKYKMEYGYTPGTRWIEKLQFGGTYRGGRVQPREMVGLNRTDMTVIENIMADFVLRRVMKGR